MEIVASTLEKYCIKNGSPIHVAFDTVDAIPTLTFILGEYEQHGNVKVFLDHKEIEEILELNNIIGKGSLVEKILNSKTSSDPDFEIEELIYDTLSKYVLEMLFASHGQIYYPEITPLDKHIGTYFRYSFDEN